MRSPLNAVIESRFLALAILSSAALAAGCQSAKQSHELADHSLQPADSAIDPVPHVVTADIQADIESYIDEQTRLGGGYFTLPFDDKELRLKLVRVHTEYLANLGPRRHFACVDLASIEGDVYDVDFFLAGDPGVMTVTETTVHKINGQPFYLWKQQPDGTWIRESVDEASRALLGVI